MTQGLTNAETLDSLGLDSESLLELLTTWEEERTGLLRQFLPSLHDGGLKKLVMAIRGLAKPRPRVQAFAELD